MENKSGAPGPQNSKRARRTATRAQMSQRHDEGGKGSQTLIRKPSSRIDERQTHRRNPLKTKAALNSVKKNKK